jgi:plasmid replication initiation protein
LSLENISPLKNVNSIRIYEEIMRFVNLNKNKKHINVKEYIVSYLDLRFLLGMNNSKEYRLFADFRRFVLVPIQKEILLYTNLHFEIEEIKEKNKVKYLRFFDIKIKNEQLELPLFDRNNEIKESEDENIQFVEVKKREKRLKFTEEQTEVKETSKFTTEQLEKLEIYLKDVFSHKEIKSKYDFDYIEFYYNKVKEISDRGIAKNFAGLLYDMLITDKFNFRELKIKAEIKRNKEIAKKKIEEEREQDAKEKLEIKKNMEEQEYKRLESVFDTLPYETQKELLEKIYKETPFYKTNDGKIWNPVKWAVAKMYEKTIKRQ